MSRFLLPWFDASIAIPRAWPPARVDCAMDALIAVRARDRNGHLLHTIAAVIFVYAGALNQAPNGIATAGLLAMALARFLAFPALFCAAFALASAVAWTRVGRVECALGDMVARRTECLALVGL